MSLLNGAESQALELIRAQVGTSRYAALVRDVARSNVHPSEKVEQLAYALRRQWSVHVVQTVQPDSEIDRQAMLLSVNFDQLAALVLAEWHDEEPDPIERYERTSPVMRWFRRFVQ